ncbi:MAG TPA: indole-3-glycerol phosphate synthase TrpC [Thermomicrobiales bacterium]|nr:indole-3-glycerol phosphate synthase TrpC [Thermomicrobiales bacterium]
MAETAVQGTFLERIVAHKRREVAERKARRPFAAVERAAREQAPALDFAAALAAPGVRLIAEVKGASPSKGVLIEPFEPEAIAADYLAAGADAISVLTDEAFFRGSLDYLSAIKARSLRVATPRPVLRKDFLLDAYQVAEARAAGADAVLLIVAMLDDALLRELLAAARDYGLAALVEVHGGAELDRALAAGAAIVGINNRDLHSFKVDLATTERLAPRVPVGTIVVGESGIETAADVRRLAAAGVGAILVGESLVKAPDRAAAIRALLAGVEGRRSEGQKVADRDVEGEGAI